MKFLDRGIQIAGVVALVWAMPAGAQENLYGNKSPAQIFASDCAICHKSAQGLSKAGGPLGLGLESFLREHYTASKETAAVLAKYVQSMDSGPAAPDKNTKRTGAKPAAKKPGDGKTGDGKSADKPSGDSKAEVKSETKPEAKPEPKPEAKPAEAKPEKSE